MDELDFLKQHWNNDSASIKEKTMSKNDIYTMLHKNSSSILKTLFYISVFELVLFTSLSILPLFSSSYKQHIEDDYFPSIITYSVTGISLLIIFIFVFLLRKSYTSISATDHAKKLMEDILKTINTVNYYVIYNLALAFLIMITGLYQITHNNAEIADKIAHFSTTQWYLFLGAMVLTTLAFVALIWGFYKLLYGRLIKRLKGNYNELLKLEH